MKSRFISGVFSGQFRPGYPAPGEFRYSGLLAMKRWLATAVAGLAWALAVLSASAFPVITSVSPGSGAPGTVVDIRGSGFTQILEVRFGMASALFDTISANEILATVPLDATSGPVGVLAVDGGAVTFGDFLVPPRITELSPDQAPTNAVILILGANFEGATAVRFNGTNASSFTVTSATQINAKVPPGITNGPVTVATPLGTAVSPGPFTVTGQEPFINGFVPTSGKPGDDVRVDGVNFTSGTSVTFNGVKASRVSLTSTTQLHATVPNGAGTGLVAVTNSFGGSVSADIFVVTTAPIIDDFSPIGGGPGTDVVINGSHLSNPTAVTFAGKPSTKFSSTADTQLHATVPSGATNGPIKVTTSQGSTSSLRNFLAGPGPFIFSVSPDIATPNTYVVISGLNLANPLSVKFNGVPATSFQATAPTQLNVVVPAGASSGPLTVITSAGTNRVDYYLVDTGKPLITDFNPAAGAARAAVIIDGLALAKASSVKFNGTAAQFSATADTQISAVVPDGATTGPISISTPAGTTVSSTSFFVAPHLTSFTPTVGVAGTPVTIKGANLVPLVAVRFREVTAAVQSAAPNQVVASVPDDAITGPINIVTPAGIVGITNVFTVPPTLRQFTPPNGTAGTKVTIYGTGFGGVTGVAFGTVNATSFSVVASTQLVATVPAQAVTGPIKVTTTSGSASSSSSFVIGPALDLAVSQTQSTNVAFENQVLTYLITLTNQGPSAATAVALTDDLPDTVQLISASATQGRLSTNDSQVRLETNSLPNAASIQLTVKVLTTQPGPITNLVSVTAKEPDLNSGNNSSVQTATVLANPAVLAASEKSPGTLTLSWPVAATNFILQTTDVLAPNRWQSAGVTPSVSGTQKIVNLPIQNGNRFFRLFRP